MEIINHKIATLVEQSDAVMFDCSAFMDMVKFAKKNMTKVQYHTLGDQFQFDILRDDALPQGMCVGPEGTLRGALRYIKYCLPLELRPVLVEAYNFDIIRLKEVQ